ncbi:MAG TPA: ROK family protein [Verrucomicrobiae bacterium]
MKLAAQTIAAPLDSRFQPFIWFARDYVAAARKTGRAVPLVLGLERERRLLSRCETWVLPEAGPATILYVERLVKSLLWAWGAGTLYVGGPVEIGRAIKKIFSPRGARKFDCAMMASAYGRPFVVRLTSADQVPAARESNCATGGHLNGCRIGFDLGASDYKFSAVMDGRIVYTDEVPWDPKNQSNPDYHYHHVNSALHRAAAYLPRVDAIGGSSAGIIVDNEIRVASLLRAIPRSKFSRAAGMFKRIGREWGVPVQVLNDGDVTALAGALSLGARGMLGIAMGSSQAAGFMDRQGRIPGWLNELAFVPIDLQPAAAVDEWSGDRGTGVMYFSQQAVNKLLPAAGIRLPARMPLPERLATVQNFMAKGDERTARIYQTIGVYLGFALAQYADYYQYESTLILGRVTTGPGGDLLLNQTRSILKKFFPELHARLEIRVPDEKSRRVGQAVAAASLPPLLSRS